MFLKERQKGQEDEEEDISSYWTTLRKQEDTGNSDKEYQISLSGELALEVAVDLSQYRPRSDEYSVQVRYVSAPRIYRSWFSCTHKVALFYIIGQWSKYVSQGSTGKLITLASIHRREAIIVKVTYAGLFVFLSQWETQHISLFMIFGLCEENTGI